MKSVFLQKLGLVISFAWKRGLYHLWLLAVGVAPLFYLISRVSLRLDRLFFPALRKVKVRKPIFIIAHPRSGTSFLQKLVSLHPQVASFKTWEMFFPSVLLRRILEPLIEAVHRIGGGLIQHARDGHKIELTGVAEEEGLFLHHLDSELLTYIFPEGLVNSEYRDKFMELGWNDTHRNLKAATDFREYLNRQMYLTGTSSIVVNSNPSVFRINTLLSEFPDAKFIFIHRTPEDTVPSFLSLAENTVGRKLPYRLKKDFYRQKYRWSLSLYRYFMNIRATLPKGSLLEIDFNDLITSNWSTKQTLSRVFRFSGLKTTQETWEAISKELNLRVRRPHINYPLEYFSISPKALLKDFNFYLNATRA